MSVCHIEAPCKINLHLRIKEKRADGFHELESVFAALEFSDSLEFELLGKDGSLDFIQRHGEGGGFCGKNAGGDFQIPPEKNLVCRAVSVFREKTGFKAGIRAVLTKRVPMGAGLGGGSSDAASTLMALDFMAGTSLGEKDLLEMGQILGSDVPFFFYGGAAWVSGRGEKIKKYGGLPPLSVLLVKPDFSVSTAGAFAEFDKHEKKAGTAPALNDEEISPWDLERILARPPSEWPFFNDFLPVLPGAVYFNDICARLKSEGAAFAGLSGSGSCCFGLFTEKKQAEKAFFNMQNKKNSIKLSFFLAQRPDPVLK